MTKSNKGNITVGTTVVIESLEISDPQVVASVKAAQAENRNLVDYITASVEIGVKALQATGVNLGIEQLADGIANAEKAMGKASKDLATSLAEKLDAIAGDQGSFTLGIECYMQEFTKDLEELTGGENSVIREGIKKQLDAMSKALTDNFTRATNIQKDEIAKMLDTENAQSPLRIMSRTITTQGEAMAQTMAQILSAVSENKGRNLEALKGTSKGADYETKAIDAISVVAGASGDEPLATGNTPGKRASKKGDAVIHLREGLGVKASMVVEAKDMSSLTTDSARRKYWLGQAEGARKTRGAIGFLGLCKNLKDMPGGQRISVLDKLGQNLVLAYDPDNDSPELLSLVYQVVKMHSLSVVGSGVEVNPAAINSYVEESFVILDRFESLHDAVAKIKSNATKVSSISEGIKDELTGHLRSIRREVAGNTEQLVLKADKPLELTSWEEDGFVDDEEFGINLDRPDQVA
jgi:hypothetical protein